MLVISAWAFISSSNRRVQTVPVCACRYLCAPNGSPNKPFEWTGRLNIIFIAIGASLPLKGSVRRTVQAELHPEVRWSGFPGQPLSLTSKAGYRP